MHESLYEPFVEKFVAAVKVCPSRNIDIHDLKLRAQAYKLGDPLHEETNLGPVVSVASAERIKKQVADAG